MSDPHSTPQTILALDLGTTTGWALSSPDGTTLSGTASFRGGRYEGGGMRFLRFRCWLDEISDQIDGSDLGGPWARVLQIVKEAMPEGGIGRSQLTRRTQFLNKRERDCILNDLLGAGLIESRKAPTKTNSRTVFQLTGKVETRIDLVVFEEVRRHLGTDAAHVYGGLLATLTAWCEARGLPYQGLPVGAVKKHATGRGNAPKQAVIAAMRALGHVPGDNNEADALALLHFARQGGLQ